MDIKGNEIIFEDDFLLVINKKPNLLVIPTPKKERYTLLSLVNEYLQPKKEKAYPCHRLDRPTSGLIVFAKSIENQRKIMAQFKEGKVEKRYLGIVQGRFRKKHLVLKGYIKPQKKSLKYAISQINCIKSFKDFSVLQIRPLTGRTNQIRIQLAEIGHPLIGERKYTLAKNWLIKFRRVCLHAYYLKFRHPYSKDILNLTCELPQDIKKFFEEKKLRVVFKQKERVY